MVNELAARQAALLRDGFRCFVCRVPTTEVHHIAPRAAFGHKRADDCWHIKNLITLCGAHHAEAGHPVNRMRHLQALRARYGYDYSDDPWTRLLEERA